MSKRRDHIDLSRRYSVQHRQIGTENLAGSRIQHEETIDDPVLELILVRGDDNDMELPRRTFLGATRLGIPILQEFNLLDVLCDVVRRGSVWIALQDIDRFSARLRLGKQRGSVSIAQPQHTSGQVESPHGPPGHSIYIDNISRPALR